MKASEILRSKLIDFEGCELTSYKHENDVWTIGIGHTKGVKEGQHITEQQALSLMNGDLLPIENFLNKLNILKTQGQFDAIADFCFNLGINAFDKSTLKRLIVSDVDDDKICVEIQKWCHSGGKVLGGLVKRRQWECSQWIK